MTPGDHDSTVGEKEKGGAENEEQHREGGMEQRRRGGVKER
jgi:hypothetical protein